MEQILITGMSGGLANLVAKSLSEQYEIIGIDSRPYRRNWVYPGKFLLVAYTRRMFTEIFHRYQIRKVLHLGRIWEAKSEDDQRFHSNLLATSHLLEICSKYEVDTLVLLSTFHVYGAHPQNPLYISEEHPLRIAQIFSEGLRALELDSLATSYLWKNLHTRTVLLRPCNIVGPHIKNTISKMIRSKFIPQLLGFDPMQQFIHEIDMVHAIQITLEQPQLTGVYNLVGGDAIPISKVIELRGAQSLPIPYTLASPLLHSLSLVGLGVPLSLMDYFRFPVLISDKKFRSASGYQNQLSSQATLENL